LSYTGYDVLTRLEYILYWCFKSICNKA